MHKSLIFQNIIGIFEKHYILMKRNYPQNLKFFKGFIINSILFFTAILSFNGCDYFFPPLSGDKISVTEAEKYLQKNKNNEDVKLIDLDTKNEYDSLHIEGAINIDFSMTDFSEKIINLDREKRYILIDMNGRKSAMAFQLFKEENFSKVHWIEGGLIEWQKHGFKTVLK